MVSNDNEELAGISKDWEHMEGEERILDLDEIDYNQFLLNNPDMEEEQPKEESIEPLEKPECYMNVQDP